MNAVRVAHKLVAYDLGLLFSGDWKARQGVLETTGANGKYPMDAAYLHVVTEDKTDPDKPVKKHAAVWTSTETDLGVYTRHRDEPTYESCMHKGAGQYLCWMSGEWPFYLLLF